MHLKREQLIVEVQYGAQRHGNVGDNHSDLCAPIWLRVGRVNDPVSFLARLPVWPIWDAQEGLVSGDAAEVDVIIRRVRSSVRGGLILRSQAAIGVQKETVGNSAAMTLGTAEEPLRLSLEQLSALLRDMITFAARK